MIDLRGVSKYYGDAKVVDDVSLRIEAGETLVLLGTSGSGKTTLLKMINRLVEYEEGSIHFDQLDIKDVDAVQHRRSIGYVIQNSGLFPHMTIKENVSVVPRLLKKEPAETNKKINTLLSLLKLEPQEVLHRFPHELSGGQQQRIGIARGLAGDPVALLMDEPFGALDPITRKEVRNDFKELLKDQKTTTIIVTHDVLEAIELADRICLLDFGRIQQIGTSKELLFHPGNEFVNDFFQSDRFQAELTAIKINEIQKEVEQTSSVLEYLKEAGVDQSTVMDSFYEYKTNFIAH
ncbi:MAG: ABC transporter ATP-binding protein [Bacteroidota bacterium]